MTSPDAVPVPSAPPPPPPRRRWLTVLLCSVIFLAGGVVGGGVTGVVMLRQAQYAVRHPEDMPRRIAVRLQGRLDLEPGQVREVEHILARHQASLMELRAEVLERADPDLDLLESDVAGVLLPGQAERWREHYRELRATWVPRAVQRPRRPVPEQN